MTFLVLWILGEAFMFVYITFQPELDPPLFTNYAFNLVLTGIIFYYKIYPEEPRNDRRHMD